MGYVVLEKIYLTKKGQLRAKILIETENSTQSHILKITRKNSSLISANGYSFFVYLIDIDMQQIGILVPSKGIKKYNHLINVGGKVTIDTLILESNLA